MSQSKLELFIRQEIKINKTNQNCAGLTLAFVYLQFQRNMSAGRHCASCGNAENPNQLERASDALYPIFRENRDCPRNAVFCPECRRLATRKLNRRQKINEVRLLNASRSSNGSGISNASRVTEPSYDSIQSGLRAVRRVAADGMCRQTLYSSVRFRSLSSDCFL